MGFCQSHLFGPRRLKQTPSSFPCLLMSFHRDAFPVLRFCPPCLPHQNIVMYLESDSGSTMAES